MPIALADVDAILQKVERLLEGARTTGVYLKVTEHRLDDDWLYIAVVPERAGTRASDHAELMSQIERDLRKGGDDHVLLVPAIEE